MGATDEAFLLWRNQGIDAARQWGIDNGYNMSIYDPNAGKIVNTWSDGKDRATGVGTTSSYVAPSNNLLSSSWVLPIIIGAAAFMLLKKK